MRFKGDFYQNTLRDRAGHSSEHTMLIEMDLHRTFPHNILFRQGDSDGALSLRCPHTLAPCLPAAVCVTADVAAIARLRRVLVAYSYMHPVIG